MRRSFAMTRLVRSATFLVAMIASAWFAWGSDELPLDDAYIHLAYAKSLRLHEGFSYNPHDWELGTTSPLWALCLVPLALASNPIFWVRVLGATLHAAAAVLAGEVSARLAQDGGSDARAVSIARVGGALAVTFHPVLLQGATSGMELPLTALLGLCTVWATLSGRAGPASVAAALSVWSRPEMLAFVPCFTVLVAVARRERRALLPGAAAVLAAALWSSYCYVNKGSPLPNTFYAKVGVALGDSSRFLLHRVLLEEPWFVSGIGLIAIFLRVRARRTLDTWAALALAYVAAVVLTALSRPLNPEVLFNQQRYFAHVAFVPPVLVGAVSPWVVPRLRLAFFVPVLAASLLFSVRARGRARAQEHSTLVLHREVARYVTRTLPPASRLVVEGAGTLRYLTPRTMLSIDLVGLNAYELVHAPTFRLRLCYVAAARPTHLIVPAEFLPQLANLFRGHVLERFLEPAFGQVLHPFARQVTVVEVSGLAPGVPAMCAAALAKGDSR